MVHNNIILIIISLRYYCFVIIIIIIIIIYTEQESRDILSSISSEMKQPFIALFDPIIQHDTFGKVMTQNLTKAKIITNPTMSLLNTRTLQNQIDKLYNSGFDIVTGCDFLTCFDAILSSDDRRRANMIEMLDEIEEWVLIMRHYCFVVAGSCNTQQKQKLTKRYCSMGEENIFGLKSGRCITSFRE